MLGSLLSVIKHLPILLAEDSEDDVFFVRRAFQKLDLPNELIVAKDGQEAIEYLEGAVKQPDRNSQRLPGLLLLDLKMPLKNGFDVLAWLQTQPSLKRLPVVILSSSALESDMEKARQLGAADYRVKSLDFDHLVKTLQELHSRWLSTRRTDPG